MSVEIVITPKNNPVWLTLVNIEFEYHSTDMTYYLCPLIAQR